ISNNREIFPSTCIVRPPARMSLGHRFQVRLPSWSDWLTLALMSFAAPWIAACIYSAYVYRYDLRLYHAEDGGMYFHGSGAAALHPSFWSLPSWVVACAIPATPTFLVLLLFRRRALCRWTIWLCAIVLWTYLCFKMEVTYR